MGFKFNPFLGDLDKVLNLLKIKTDLCFIPDPIDGDVNIKVAGDSGARLKFQLPDNMDSPIDAAIFDSDDPTNGGLSVDFRPSDTIWLSNFVRVQDSMELVNTESGISSQIQWRLDNSVPSTGLRLWGVGTTDPGFGSFSMLLGTGVGSGSNNILSTGGAFDFRIQAASGQVVDIGPRWRSSDTLSYAGNPDQAVEVNPTFNTINDARWNVFGMRLQPQFNATAGGASFISPAGGFSSNANLNIASMASNPSGAIFYSATASSSVTGGSRTMPLSIGINCQTGANTSGTVSNAYAVNAQALTGLGGTNTAAISGRFLMPINFLGGTNNNAYGIRINGAGNATTNRIAIYQDNATPENRILGNTAFGYDGTPFWEVDISGALRLQDTTSSIILGGTGASDHTVRMYQPSAGVLSLGGRNGTNNEDLEFDFESTADIVEISSTTGSDIRFEGMQIGVNVDPGSNVLYLKQLSDGNGTGLKLEGSGGNVNDREFQWSHISGGQLTFRRQTIGGGGASYVYSVNTSGQFGVGQFGAQAQLDVAGDCIIREGLDTREGRIKNVTRVTSTPYTVLASDHNVFVDSDSAAVTVNLPAGVAGTEYRIVNTGSSGNDVTINPDGSELLLGANSSFALSDGDSLIIVYETTEGWW